jgi:hypothetical protein
MKKGVTHEGTSFPRAIFGIINKIEQDQTSLQKVYERQH